MGTSSYLQIAELECLEPHPLGRLPVCSPSMASLRRIRGASINDGGLRPGAFLVNSDDTIYQM